MTQKLRRKFVLISVSVLSVMMLILTLVINIANYTAVRQEIEQTAEELTEGRPAMPERNRGGKNHQGRHGESIYESRYFTVMEGPGGLVADISNVSSYTAEEAVSMAETAIKSGKPTGFVDECYFLYGTGTQFSILFLDCGSRLASIRSLFLISLVSCCVGILFAWILMALLSSRAVRPFVENIEKQKRFITDASHELKTPLSVISANMEVLALDDPDNEWILSTRRQTGMMTRMVNDMVFLTRSDEGIRNIYMTEFDLQELLCSTADPFTLMAETCSRVLKINAPEPIKMRGDRRGIERLISILCDNALKYSPEGDTILLNLSTRGAFAVIETDNAASSPLSPDKISRFFDRFYRADDSRTKKEGRSGFGIGLAIARAVCEAHGGDAKAFSVGERVHVQCRLKLR